MMQSGVGGPPGVNQLPVTTHATLRVANIPSFVTADDLARLFRQLEGCLDSRILGRQPGGDQVGYVEFSDKICASKAKNLYHGWTGWGGRGLTVELTDFSMSQLTQLPGQKRMREGEDLLQSNGNFKQARADVPGMGMMGGGGLAGAQQPQQALGGQPTLQQPQQQQQPAREVTAMGILQNLTSMTNLLQQQGIAQQLLSAAQQQAGGGGIAQPQQAGGMLQQPQQQPMAPQQGGLLQGGMLGQGAGVGGGGGFDSYNPTGLAGNAPLQQQPQQQQVGGMGVGMLPQQQPQQVQQGAQYVPQLQQPQQQQVQYGLQQDQPSAGGYLGQPMQQPQQQQLLQPPQQQAYNLMPQQQHQQPVMLQGGMGQAGGMLPQPQPVMQQQQPMMQPQQQPMMQPQQQQPQMMQPPQPQNRGMQGGNRGDIVAPAAMRQYPPDACNTLYIEGLPADVTRRELLHIFRSHEGYRSLRLVIKDSKKHAGEKLVMAFVEYSNTYFATEAMDALQGYPFDLDDPETMTFFIKYARPMENPHRRPAGGPPPMGMMGGRGRGGPAPGPGADMRGGRGGGPEGGRGGRGGGMPDMHPGRGGPMGGRGGRGGRFGGGGPPPRESPRGREDY